MRSFISKLFGWILAIGLSIFTASRTLDLLAWALPANQTLYQWLGLAAFDGGMYIWSLYFVGGAKGTPQRSIALIMAVFSIVAVGIVTIVDLALDAGQSGKVAQLNSNASMAVIVFLGVAFAINVAAYLACHLLSIDNMRAMKEQDAEDVIYTAGLRAITSIAPSIAADAAPHLATEWANRTWQQIVPGVKHETLYLGPAKSIDTPPPAIMPTKAPAPAKKNMLNKLASVFIPGKQQPAPIAPVPQVPSTRLYRDVQRVRRQAPSSIAAMRLARRQQRYTRPIGPLVKETVPNPLAQASLAQEQDVNAPMKSTQKRGSSGKRAGRASGKTSEK